MPPAISNEPIGPGSSVSSEADPIKLCAAAVFAYLANLPASGNNRNLDFNGVSINNVARVEVTNSNTPETSGSSLAGSINMVPRSAFERARPLLNATAYVMFRDNDRSLRKQPGPNEGYNHHVQPGSREVRSASQTVVTTPDDDGVMVQSVPQTPTPIARLRRSALPLKVRGIRSSTVV